MSNKAKRIPIAAAKRIAEQYGYEQVVVLARSPSNGDGWSTTYGINKAHCNAAAKWGKVFGELQRGKAKITYTG